MKLTRPEARDIAGAFIKANFRVHALGHFDLSFEEIVNVVMIIENSESLEDVQSKLSRYYDILERKHMFGWYALEQQEHMGIKKMKKEREREKLPSQ